MDQKTIEALSLMQSLAQQVKELRKGSADLSAALTNPRAIFVPMLSVHGMVLSCAFDSFIYPVLCLDESERAEIVAVLEKYSFRLDSLLSGCSIRLSQGIKEMIAEQDKLRNDLISQAATIKAADQGGKK